MVEWLKRLSRKWFSNACPGLYNLHTLCILDPGWNPFMLASKSKGWSDGVSIECNLPSLYYGMWDT